MQAITLNPSVDQLTRNRRSSESERDPRSLRAPLPGKTTRSDSPRMLVHTLRRALNESCTMQVGQSIATPIGTVSADIVLENGGRRAAVLVGESAKEREAVLLVYGAYDVIFCVSRLDAEKSALAVVSLLEAAEPSLFKTAKAARLAALSTVRRVHSGRSTLSAEGWDGRMAATVRRRRINRPAEWAREFEEAISRPAGQRQAS
ncbi:MAG: hypothetical protein ACI9W4_000766 [Rhodothermales bacterium]|jgi:hypothetical protein